MAARTPAYTKEFKSGKGRILVFRFTTVNDTDTFVSGLNAVSSAPLFSAAWIGDPATQASAGGHLEYSAGTVTFHPSTDNLGCDLTVYI